MWNEVLDNFSLMVDKSFEMNTLTDINSVNAGTLMSETLNETFMLKNIFCN